MLWTSSNKHIHRIPNFFYLILIFMLYSSQKNIYLILYINPSIKLYYISVKKEKKEAWMRFLGSILGLLFLFSNFLVFVN